MSEVEHSVVISHVGADRIPEGIPTAVKFGMKSQHFGWPGIVRLPDGQLLVSASERIRHVDPFGRNVIVRSSDGGRSWSGPSVFVDTNGDDRDSSLCVLPDGTLVASWFINEAWTDPARMIDEWSAIAGSIKPDTHRLFRRGWLRRSHDGGLTWEDRIYPTIVGLHAGPSPLHDGSLIYCGSYEEERYIATRSTDGGKTWGVIGTFPVEHQWTQKPDGTKTRNRLQFNENHCLEVAPNRILCAMRPTYEPRNVHISISNDAGVTWSKPRDLGVHGYPPTMTRLAGGAVLLVFADRNTPQAIRGLLSWDQGETWDTGNILQIRQFEHNADMGYPSAVEISPGEVLCVYYYVPHPYPTMTADELAASAAGCVPPDQVGILATRFRL